MVTRNCLCWLCDTFSCCYMHCPTFAKLSYPITGQFCAELLIWLDEIVDSIWLLDEFLKKDGQCMHGSLSMGHMVAPMLNISWNIRLEMVFSYNFLTLLWNVWKSVFESKVGVLPVLGVIPLPQKHRHRKDNWEDILSGTGRSEQIGQFIECWLARGFNCLMAGTGRGFVFATRCLLL